MNEHPSDIIRNNDRVSDHFYFPVKEKDRSFPFPGQLFPAALSHFSFALKAEAPFGRKKKTRNHKQNHMKYHF